MKATDQLQSLVIITGMSGSGKHTAFKAFEDLGYFCVDNLPIPLIARLVQMARASGGKILRLAIVVDIRVGVSVKELQGFLTKLKHPVSDTTIVFVDASDEVLARRYSETRRVHPLAQDQSPLQGIRSERRRLANLRALAGLVIDTSDFTVHDLRNFIYDHFHDTDQEPPLSVSVLSFGFKHGIPYNSDLVFDVRFLPNPNFVPELKSKTGNDSAIVEYMAQFAETSEILAKIHDMLEYLLPKYTKEGKRYLAISVGCTGGKHRSVVVANGLKERLEKSGHKVNLIHRDLHNE